MEESIIVNIHKYLPLDIFLVLNFWNLSPFSPILFVCLYYVNNRKRISLLWYLLYLVLTFSVLNTTELYATWYVVPILEESIESFLVPQALINFIRVVISCITFSIYLVYIYRSRHNLYSESINIDIEQHDERQTKELQILQNYKSMYSFKILVALSLFTLVSIYYMMVMLVYTHGLKYLLEDLEVSSNIVEYFIWYHSIVHVILTTVVLTYANKNVAVIFDEERLIHSKKIIKDISCKGDINALDKTSEVTTHLFAQMLLVYLFYAVLANVVGLVFYFFTSYCLKFLIAYIGTALVNWVVNNLINPCLARFCSTRVLVCFDTYEVCTMLKLPLVVQKRLNVLIKYLLRAPIYSLDFKDDVEYARMYYGMHCEV